MPQTRPTAVRAPALLLLAGAVAGLALAGGHPAEAPVATLGCAAALAGFGLASARAGRERAWTVCFLPAAILAFWAYGTLRLPRTPGEAELALPAREVGLALEIDRISDPDDRFGRARGWATVAEPPAAGRIRAGDRIYFEIEAEGAGASLRRGMRVRLRGVAEPLRGGAEGVGGRSFTDYLKSQGAHYRLARTSHLRVERGPGPFARFCAGMRERLRGHLRLGAPEGRGYERIYVAMLLGLKSDLAPAQAHRFRMSGTMHFFAISGLHIGVIAGVIAHLLLLLRVPPPLRPLVGLPLVYLYVEITGAPPSAMRAFLMTAFFWGTFVFRRQRSPFAALVGSAVLVLIWDPMQLRAAGFQLSYAVVCGILLFGLPLHERLSDRLEPFRWLPAADRRLWQRAFAPAWDTALLLFSVSFAAWLAGAPLSAVFFGFVAPEAIVLNMFLVHLAALVIVGGVLALALGLAGLAAAAAFVNHSAWLLIATMDGLVRPFSGPAGAGAGGGHFPASAGYATLAAFIGLLLWLHADRRRLESDRLLLPPLVVLGGLLLSGALGGFAAAG